LKTSGLCSIAKRSKERNPAEPIRRGGMYVSIIVLEGKEKQKSERQRGKHAWSVNMPINHSFCSTFLIPDNTFPMIGLEQRD
jgi:hypothetical protein